MNSSELTQLINSSYGHLLFAYFLRIIIIFVNWNASYTKRCSLNDAKHGSVVGTQEKKCVWEEARREFVQRLLLVLTIIRKYFSPQSNSLSAEKSQSIRRNNIIIFPLDTIFSRRQNMKHSHRVSNKLQSASLVVASTFSFFFSAFSVCRYYSLTCNAPTQVE